MSPYRHWGSPHYTHVDNTGQNNPYTDESATSGYIRSLNAPEPSSSLPAPQPASYNNGGKMQTDAQLSFIPPPQRPRMNPPAYNPEPSSSLPPLQPGIFNDGRGKMQTDAQPQFIPPPQRPPINPLAYDPRLLSNLPPPQSRFSNNNGDKMQADARSTFATPVRVGERMNPPVSVPGPSSILYWQPQPGPSDKDKKQTEMHPPAPRPRMNPPTYDTEAESQRRPTNIPDAFGQIQPEAGVSSHLLYRSGLASSQPVISPPKGVAPPSYDQEKMDRRRSKADGSEKRPWLVVPGGVRKHDPLAGFIPRAQAVNPPVSKHAINTRAETSSRNASANNTAKFEQQSTLGVLPSSSAPLGTTVLRIVSDESGPDDGEKQNGKASDPEKKLITEDDIRSIDQVAKIITEGLEKLPSAGNDGHADEFQSGSDFLLTTLANACRDKAQYKYLLHSEGDSAQKLIDTLQTLLEYPKLDTSTKSTLLKALLRLSKKSGLYPRCFVLKEVQRGDAPLTGGHFGEIWKGKFRGQNVCLKVVKVYETSRVELLVKAFWKEALIWAHLSHINLLPFYGVYQLQDGYGRICLVSPWMEKGNITNYLNDHPEVIRALLISDILQGLIYLHGENIVHGDLKGANILISASGRACLADFGLSSVMDVDILRWTSIQSTAQAGGTLRWQAPELILLDDEPNTVSKASDIYAFSCVCYEILTGQLPFYEFPYDATVLMKIMRDERPSRPSKDSKASREWGLTDGMWELIEDCWKTNPSNRLISTEVESRLSRELEDVLDDRISDDWESLSCSGFRRVMYDVVL